MSRKINYPREKYLWKYMDLFKFLNFIRHKELYFSSLNDFDDVYESVGKVNSYFLGAIKQTAEIKLKDRNPAIEPDYFEQRSFDIIDSLHALSKDRARYFANCFYSAENESVAMWNLYSGVQGIAIRFNATSLYKFIKDYYYKKLEKDYYLIANKVRYEKVLYHKVYDENGILKSWLNDISGTPLVKDEAYIHENEYRFIFEKRSGTVGRPIVKLDDFSQIEFSVFVQSNIEDWKFTLIDELLAEAKIKSDAIKSKIITKGLVTKISEKYLEKIINIRYHK